MKITCLPVCTCPFHFPASAFHPCAEAALVPHSQLCRITGQYARGQTCCTCYNSRVKARLMEEMIEAKMVAQERSQARTQTAKGTTDTERAERRREHECFCTTTLLSCTHTPSSCFTVHSYCNTAVSVHAEYEDLNGGCPTPANSSVRPAYIQSVDPTISDIWSYYKRALTFQVGN